MTDPIGPEPDQDDLENWLRDLRARVIAPTRTHWIWRTLTFEMLRNIMVIVGIPVALLGAWNVVDKQFLRQAELERNARLAVAVGQLRELESYNEGVFRLQVQQKPGEAFAITEAKRGRLERLTKDLFGFWEDYPDELTTHEKTTLAEGLMTQKQTAEALRIVQSIEQSGMDAILQGDLDLLTGRILFARGNGQDPDAARDALRAAMAHAQAIEDGGESLTLTEKYVATWLLNELWLKTDCGELDASSGILGDMMNDGTTPEKADAVRLITYDVMAAYDRICAGT